MVQKENFAVNGNFYYCEIFSLFYYTIRKTSISAKYSPYSIDIDRKLRRSCFLLITAKFTFSLYFLQELNFRGKCYFDNCVSNI